MGIRKKTKALMCAPTKASISRSSAQPEPDDLAVLEERAQGRAVLDNPNQHPTFIFRTVKPRLQNGSPVQPPILLDSRIARAGGREIHREEGESYEAFQHRAAGYVPVGGLDTYLVMVPTDELPEKPDPTPSEA